MKHPPEHLKKLLWEYDIKKLHKDDNIVIERILSFGSFEDIRYIWLSSLIKYFKENKPTSTQKVIIFGLLWVELKCQYSTISLWIDQSSDIST